MKILFRCIFNAALFLMLIVAMVLLLPGLFGIRPYVVYSGSMEPKIPTGAVVFTKEGAYSPETGDIGLLPALSGLYHIFSESPDPIYCRMYYGRSVSDL